MIEKYCDKVILMEKGKIKKEGKVREVVEGYKEESLPALISDINIKRQK